MPEAAPVTPTITGDQLAKLTGFSVGELNALARKGYFPRPKNGAFEQLKVIPGCFKAYRDKLQECLPTLFESMGQCSERTGIPHSVLAEAKKESDAFKAHRIQLIPLLRWLFADDENGEAVNWGERLKKVQALRQEIALEKDKDRAISKDDAAFATNRAMSLLFSALDRRSNIDLPPALRGLTETDIQKRLVESDEALKKIVRDELSKLIEEKK